MVPLHHYKLFSLIGLCLLLLLRTNANTLTPSHNELETTSLEPTATEEPTATVEPTPSEESSASVEPTATVEPSSVTVTMSLTPTPTPPSRGYSQIRVLYKDCMYLDMENLSVNFTSPSFIKRNFTSRDLNVTYRYYVDQFLGCVNPHAKGNTTHQFMRTYYDSNNQSQFWFLFEFEKLSSSNEWELMMMKHGWPNINESIFTYDNCGHSLKAEVGLTYRCGKLTCNGYESLDTTVTSVLVMEHLKVQAFLEGIEIPALSVSCNEPSEDNHLVYIIVGLVVGFTIVSAVVVIVGSFLYKHYKYGPYNLLD